MRGGDVSSFQVDGLRNSRWKVTVDLWVDAPTLRAAAIVAVMSLRDMPESFFPSVYVSSKAEPEPVKIDPGSMSDTGGWS